MNDQQGAPLNDLQRRGPSAPEAAAPTGWRRLRRLWQPHRALFWVMVLFNLLGSACAWALHLLSLNPVGLLLFAAVALLNSGAGLIAAWKLLQLPAPGEPATP